MRAIITLFFFFTFLQISAQLNRYPYIQSTTQNSTIIAWKTNNDVIGKVAYGFSASNLTDTIYESVASKRHALTLKNLEINTKYYYTIFSGNTALASEYFNTAKDSTSQNFSFIQYGDCGYNSAAQHTIGDLMEADSAEFAVICGDIDQGGVPHISNSEGGDDYDEIFFDVYNDGVNSKMLSRECHYPAIGNHDTYADNGATYEAEFYLPHNNVDSTERYYSFTWGDAKFIALDVITPFDPTSFPFNQAPISQRWWTDFRPGSAQYQFLEDELRCNDKKWVFIYFHEGPWTNYWGADYNLPNAIGGDYYQYEGNLMVRQHLVPLFEQYGVDFVLVGHSHLYEQAFKNGVWYITSGGAGDIGGNTQYGNNPEILKSIIDNMYVKFYVDSNTVSYDVINDDNNIIDTFSLTKNYTDYNVSSLITNVSCFGNNDGAVTLNVQGPKSPYTVEWFDGTMGLTRSNLSAGTYYAYVRNVYGCEKVTAIEITQPAPLQVEILSENNNLYYCQGDSLLLFANGEFDTYNWSTGASIDSIYVSAVGNVSLDVIDSNACLSNTAQVSISDATTPSSNFVFTNAGAIYNFLATGNNVNTYYWDFGDGTRDTTSTNLINHVFTQDGVYSVNLIAENNCDTSSFAQTIIIDVYTGINEIFIDNAMTIQPNPFQDFTEISVKGLGKKLSVEVYNLIGEIVLIETINEKSFKLYKHQLGVGTYYLKVKNDKGQFTVSKVIVI